MIQSKWSLALGLLLLLAALVAGCGSEDDVVGPPLNQLPFPSDSQTLMENYLAIYKDMLIEEFANLLHPSYKMILLPEMVALWRDADDPLTGDHFSRDQEVVIHRNLFSGQTGADPSANPVSPVSGFAFDLFEKTSAWEPVVESDPDFAGFGAYRTTFRAVFYLNCPDNYRMEIREVFEFFAAPVDDGGRERWVLLGIREIGPLDKGTEAVSFGHVKAMFR